MTEALITDPLPAEVAGDVQRLDLLLDATIPKRAIDYNLLIATWNIRAFGDLTKNWVLQTDDSPKRNFHGAVLIATILQRFDIIAVQEVKGNLRALRHTLKYMGQHWAFLLTDVTHGGPGNDERLAFIYDTRRVRLSGLAAELVVPDDLSTPFSTPANAFQRQFVRTPYAVSFLAGRKTVTLVTLHVIYGNSADDRTAELRGIARWLRSWAEQQHEYGQNLMALGDFNIDRKGDARWAAFTSTGLAVPDALNAAPRTVFDDGQGDAPDKFYDQIA